MSQQLGLGIGIDLGTTYSCVAMMKDNDIQILSNAQGNRTTPSCVAFSNTIEVGDGAKNQAAQNAANTVYDAKRLIGRKFTDKEVQTDAESFPFKVVKGPHNKPLIEVTFKGVKKQFSAEEISAEILKAMKKTAEVSYGSKLTDAVITVPAYFNDAQRQATKDAGQIAGLKVHRIINEPTAAAIAYGLHEDEKNKDRDETNILIFDLGGGTFDVSVLTLEEGVFEVKSTSGDTHLGGEDFDRNLLMWCLMQFGKKKMGSPDDLKTNKRAMSRLKSQCEKAKRLLTRQTKCMIEVENLHENIDFSLEITRARFEQLCAEEFKKCLEPVKKALLDSGLKKKPNR